LHPVGQHVVGILRVVMVIGIIKTRTPTTIPAQRLTASVRLGNAGWNGGRRRSLLGRRWQ
jgi:hypothetical protein